MKQRISILLSLAVMTLSVSAVSAQSRVATGFDKLKTLAGEWQGTGPDGQAASVTYQVVSGGTAVMETLKAAKEPDMVTIYHPDGDKLVVTHYCSIGNQPRMQAEVPAGEIKKLDFTFVSVTNLTSQSTGHMQKLTVRFQDKDHIEQEWTWRQDGKDMTATFKLERKK